MRTAVLVPLLLSTTVSAQVTVEARAASELVVFANAPPAAPDVQRVTQGTNVTAGYSLAARVSGGASGTAIGRASSELTITHGRSESVLELRESAQGGSDLHSSQTGGSFGPHSVATVYRSPRVIPARLRIECCAGASSQIASVSGCATVDGVTQLVATPSTTSILCLFGQYAQATTVPILVGPGGVRVEITTSGGASGSLRGIGDAVCTWRVTLTPDPDFPARVTRYGSACGASLQSAIDLRLPGALVITLEDPSRPPLAWITIGLGRTAEPFFGCTLWNEHRVVAPWMIDANGHASVVFVPPPMSGLTLTAQGLTLGTALHASEGLEFVSR